MIKHPGLREYDRRVSAVFRKTKEEYGGLSNMAAGFPLRINGVRILTSEALYQACRFPHLPDVQRLIIAQPSPMTAKMKGKPYRKQTRPDWDALRVNIMRWCLRVKLAQNWVTFGDLLNSTGNLPIVEESRKDDFWGAKATSQDKLVGANVLGRLLMELREEHKKVDNSYLKYVHPPNINDFLLFGEPIDPVGQAYIASSANQFTNPDDFENTFIDNHSLLKANKNDEFTSVSISNPPSKPRTKHIQLNLITTNKDK